MTYEDLDIFQTEKVFDLQGGTVNLPEVLTMLESSRIPKIICRCDYQTAGALHESLRNTAVVSTSIAEDESTWIYYHMVECSFSIWLGRFEHRHGKPRRMAFDRIGLLVNFQPKFEWFPEFVKVPFPFTKP